jgi:lysozyme
VSDLARELLIREEGDRQFVYRCSAGYLTAGVGRNLETRGLLPDERALMLENDLAYARGIARLACKRFESLSESRQAVLISMAHQMGPAGLQGFRSMLRALERGDYEEAAREMLDSEWARKDTPARAKRHAEMMRTGVVPSEFA